MPEQVTALEKSKRRLHQSIFDIEDEISAKRDAPVAALEKRMHQKTGIMPPYALPWSAVECLEEWSLALLLKKHQILMHNSPFFASCLGTGN